MIIFMIHPSPLEKLVPCRQQRKLRKSIAGAAEAPLQSWNDRQRMKLRSKIRNSNTEIRNNFQNSKSSNPTSTANESRLKHSVFGHTDIVLSFRASDFVLRTLVSNRCFDACLDVVAFRGIQVAGHLFVSPGPAADLGRVLAVLVDVFLVIDKRVAELLLGVGRPRA